jgi:predicted  nucleic acid-binding Zn-ribbon protein
MDQVIINWLFAGVGTAIGWVLKVIWDAIKELKADLRVIERDLPEVYVRKDDFKEAISDIKQDLRDMRSDMKDGFNQVDATLNTLFEKLNKKEDRNAR